jgi:DNA-binding transcriptional ArsR family regulator
VDTYEDRILNALGDPTRRAVLKRLLGGGRSVADIAEGMAVSRPAVSQHLKILRAARLVNARAEGTRRVYAIDTRGIESVRKWLDQFWDRTLLAFKDAAELEATTQASGQRNERLARKTRKQTRSLPK